MSLVFFALSLGACGDTSHTPSAAWVQVNEHTACEALSPDFCVGAFGFTVRNGGAFVVGPAGRGETLSGSITAVEHAQLTADVEAVASSLVTDLACDRTALVPGVADQVELTRSSTGALSVWQINPGAICYRAQREAAYRLHDDVAGLMARYYPRPFPAR